MANESTIRIPRSDETVEWSSVRDGAISLFNGERPLQASEDDIIAVFKTHPQEVIHAINEVAQQVNNGQARSGWGVLRHRVKGIAAKAQRNATAHLGPSREAALARAQQYMRAAGMFLPTEAEVIEDLFGDRGQLEPFPELQDEMLALWRELRPKVAQSEQDAIKRGLAFQAQRRLDGIAPSKLPPEARDALPFDVILKRAQERQARRASEPAV